MKNNFSALPLLLAGAALLLVAGCKTLSTNSHQSSGSATYAPAAPAQVQISPPAPAPATGPAPQIDPASLGWPRFFATNGYEFAVYQPSVDKWPGNHIEGRFALAVRPAGSSNETYGVAFFSARTEIDKVNRLVMLEDWSITRTVFPTEKTQQQIYRALIQSELPSAAKTVPLDHLEASFVISADIQKAKAVQVDNTPPRIIYTTKPAILVQVDGAPMYAPLVGDYERVINTRAVLLLNTNQLWQYYFLYAASNWYCAPSIEGPWTVATYPPADIGTALKAALAIPQTDPMYPRALIATPPAVYVSTTPTELIQTKGVANMLAITGTDLLYLPNSDDAIFYDLDDANYYVLISGRWFKGLSLYGPWTYVAQTALPADFKKIPPENPKAAVLCSIAGTPQAQEALIANSIPQTATIELDKAKLTVEYGGVPQFAPIAGTSLQYATNSQTVVIRVKSNAYYACEGGLWFVSPSATGPWAVALSVPSVIYTIPATCPIHYVTYVYVYGSTPQYVYVGYTPGYMGTIVSPAGVVVCGTGYYYPPVIVGTTYISYPPTYGYGAALAVTAAAGFAFGYAAGASAACWAEPHWGCYGYAAPCGYSYTHVNCCSANYYSTWGTAVHTSGSYGYNAYTGTSWAGKSGTTYNPNTGTSGSYNRGAAYNPYSGNYAAGGSGSAYNSKTGASAQGSRSVSGNAYTGNYDAQRQGSAYNPTTGNYASGQASMSGNVKNGTASFSSSGTAGNTKTGNSTSWNNGSMTSDRYGNTYSYNQGATAQNKSTAQSEYSSGSAYRQSQPSSSQSSYNKSSSWGGSSGSSWADRESSAQSTGSQRFSNWGGGGGSSWGGSHDWGGGGGWGGGDHSFGGFSGGGGGWGGFHGGGGFRR